MAQENDGERSVFDEREDRHFVHVHMFEALTLVADGHQHIVTGVTGPARAAGTSHIHRLRVRTSFFVGDSAGHWHWYDVMSGPAVFTSDSGHVHVFDGKTSMNDGHCHDVLNSTGQAPDIREIVADIPDTQAQVPKIKPKAMKR